MYCKKRYLVKRIRNSLRYLLLTRFAASAADQKGLVPFLNRVKKIITYSFPFLFHTNTAIEHNRKENIIWTNKLHIAILPLKL
jgi:hypothetical protein